MAFILLIYFSISKILFSKKIALNCVFLDA